MFRIVKHQVNEIVYLRKEANSKGINQKLHRLHNDEARHILKIILN